MGELNKMSCNELDDIRLIELGLAERCPKCGRVRYKDREECKGCLIKALIEEWLDDESST
jgi:hypothetical protein